MIIQVNPLIAVGVLASTATTDAAYVFLNAAVTGGRRVWAANWSASEPTHRAADRLPSLARSSVSVNSRRRVPTARWYLGNAGRKY